MFRVRISRSMGVRSAVWLMAATAVLATDPASAKRFHRHGLAASRVNYNPPFSSIVVDANSGKALQEDSADGLRHPASLTKIMTLYLLFERLDEGKLKLDSPLKVSGHAASQAPSKLGLEPGDTIEVEDAIRAIVTKSANDIAVVVAEALAGDEDEFAHVMTSKAHALGMSRTEYRNASGLPDDDQVTTARDQALLGRAIQERFPRYYRYFSTPSFTYHGNSMRNHNHLLGSVEGVDGIKTGYTEASGFNLVTSLRRGNRHLVAVVLGSRSAGARDERMRDLLDQYIARASERHTAPVIAESAPQTDQPAKPEAFRLATEELARVAEAAVRAEPTPTPPPDPSRPVPGSSEPIKPIMVKTIPVKGASGRTGSVDAASLQAGASQPANSPSPQIVTTKPDPEPPPPIINPRPGVLGVLPAQVAARPLPEAPSAGQQSNPSAPVLEVVQIKNPAPAPTPAPPATQALLPTQAQQAQLLATQAPPPPQAQLVATQAPPPPQAQPPATQAAPPPTQAQPLVTQAPAPPTTQTLASLTHDLEPAAAEPAHSAQVHTGWMIQVGALEDERGAKERLDLAQSKAPDLLRRAEPFTETFVKGDKTYVRARFAGLDKERAEAACKSLKRNDIPCMALKN
jgi:D-alanyl-D-alanine carboxypeptidase